MAYRLNDSWLLSCGQELQLPGSPWYEVKEQISEYLIHRIRQESLTYDELAKFRYLLGQEFTANYPLIEKETSTDVKRPNLTDDKLESLLKDLTLKAAKDAKCFLKKDLSDSPECFKNMISLVTKIFKVTLRTHTRAMQMTQFKQFGSNTSVIALNSLVEKDIEVLGEAVVSILQKEPIRLDNICKCLRGRLLPLVLRRLVYRLTLINKQKQFGFPGSNIGVGVLSNDEKITFQGLKEGFAKGMKAGLEELKSRDPTKSPLQHLIHLSVIQAYETLPGLQPHSKNIEIQKECSDVLNILYTYSRKFRRSFILWLFPLQVTISQERHAKEHCYDLAMWLNCVVKSCIPLDIRPLNEIVLKHWKKVIHGVYDLSSERPLSQHLSRLGVKSDLESMKTLLDLELPSLDSGSHKLVSPSTASMDSEYSILVSKKTSQWTVNHPALCLRQWLTDLFVGLTDLPVTIFLWDQFFLYNWTPDALARACAALFHAMQDIMLRSADVETLCSCLLEGAIDIKLHQIHTSWKMVSVE